MGLTLRDYPFVELVREAPHLAGLRGQYQNRPAGERRLAAQWEYDSALATEVFDNAILHVPGSERFTSSTGPSPCPGAVCALAIDPTFAPALLTVGSVEYQLGRVGEAIELFLTLTCLPADTEDLPEIIDKAGDFLIDSNDLDNAAVLYVAAATRYPEASRYQSGLGYCYGKLGEHAKAVASAQRASVMEPANNAYLSDLGWALVKAGEYERAGPILEEAARRSDGSQGVPQANLAECRRRMQSTRSRRRS